MANSRIRGRVYRRAPLSQRLLDLARWQARVQGVAAKDRPAFIDAFIRAALNKVSQ